MHCCVPVCVHTSQHRVPRHGFNARCPLCVSTPCSPQDYLFDPAHYADNPVRHGTPMDIRESSFLDNERTPQGVKVRRLSTAAAHS